jgi:hypothetical protein
VTWNSGQEAWRASIQKDGKHVTLGTFDDEVEVGAQRSLPSRRRGLRFTAL